MEFILPLLMEFILPLRRGYLRGNNKFLEFFLSIKLI